jgi:protein-S-isoprenylcysteine O-methyltransferase Ste14
LFDYNDALWRFGTSGTLLLFYGLVEMAARRGGASSDRPGVPPPRWLKPSSFVCVLAFYLLIEPTGFAVAGGAGNAAGFALAFAAMALRFGVRHGARRVRHPATATRMLFYTALPLAVGVPLGWLVLTLPAYAMSAHCSVREDRVLSDRLGEPYRALMATSHRWVPGVW